MHLSCRENLTTFWSRFAGSIAIDRDAVRILSVDGVEGPNDVAEIFPAASIVQSASDEIGLLAHPDNSFDLVVSVHGLQTELDPVSAFRELARVVTNTGLIFVATPSAGDYRPDEVSRFGQRFHEHVSSTTGMNLVDAWSDERGPFRDTIGVFSHAKSWPMASAPTRTSIELASTVNTADPRWEAGNNDMRGARSYLECLTDFHRILQPDFYLEIGVRNGRSLALSTCPALGVDPLVDITVELPSTASIVETTSDEFFDSPVAQSLPARPDLVFIDGMHLIEFVLRDFMHTERAAHVSTIVVIDDVSPNHADQASRQRQTRVWTGDVWKIRPILERFRPDLKLTVLDTYPTGLLVVSNLDPANTALWDRYDEILDFVEHELLHPPRAIVDRSSSVPPEGPEFLNFVHALTGDPPPMLSVVVVAYNMKRELPRTLATLAPEAQGLDPETYEIIVVDNGSEPVVDLQDLESICPNVSLLSITDATVSPVPAINAGLAQARGDLIGVLIDGARMASPGLLSQALACSQTHGRVIVGTHGFHLGDQIQAKAMSSGYDQTIEDDLLTSVDWAHDGYELFDISVFSGSSSRGWLVTPAETNALFTSRVIWDELGGYDERFVSPGGGIVNHDTWLRACKLPNVAVSMLLGEGTFHQFHGGVATNSPISKWPEFAAEYEAIHGTPYIIPEVSANLFGRWHDARLP